MKTLTHNQLIQILQANKGTQIIGIQALTDSKARKTNNPFGVIFKKVRATGFVGVDYQQSVEREAVRQGTDSTDFQAEKLPWGKWLLPNKVIEHNQKFYLRTSATPGQRKRHQAKVLGYYDASGNRLQGDKVKPFLPSRRESNKQQEDAGLAGTVDVRAYAFDSIQKVRVKGETYKLVA